MRLAAEVMSGDRPIPAQTPIKVGVDLGTAFTVVMVTDEAGTPLCGATQFADVVRDGVVWNFMGATDIVRDLVKQVEQRTGRTLQSGAVTIPPGVAQSDHRAHMYVLESAGLQPSGIVDEPTAANAVLGLRDGAVVDIGGGTTGVAILRDGKVIKVLDEPSGGTHLSLVLAGNLGISFEEAELAKRDPANHDRFFPVIRPVLEKQAGIVKAGIEGFDVSQVVLVGGTSAFKGIETVFQTVIGVPSVVAPEPMLVTPLGAANFATAQIEESA
jgi:ethanolamine utilization protein EutJ